MMKPMYELIVIENASPESVATIVKRAADTQGQAVLLAAVTGFLIGGSFMTALFALFFV